MIINITIIDSIPVRTDNKIKIGEYVRIIMCCYHMPSGEMLGKVSEIEEIFESINMVKLKRWGYKCKLFIH
jgi:hypothetical protein